MHRLSGVSVGCLTLVASIAAHAELRAVVTADVTRQDNGLYKYIYKVYNRSNADICINTFNVKGSPESKIELVKIPIQWRADAFRGWVVWSTTEPTEYEPILPGKSAVFGFNSPLPPSHGKYEIGGLGCNESLEDETIKHAGHVVAPGIGVNPRFEPPEVR